MIFFVRLGDSKMLLFFWRSPTILLREFLAPLPTLLTTRGGDQIGRSQESSA